MTVYICSTVWLILISGFPDMCPKPNNTGSSLSKKSHVEIFSDPIPALFSALMSEPDTQQRWITFTFPVDFYMDPYRPKLEKEFKYWTRKSLVITEHIHVKMTASGTGCCELCTLSLLYLIQVFHVVFIPFEKNLFWVIRSGQLTFWLPCSNGNIVQYPFSWWQGWAQR